MTENGYKQSRSVTTNAVAAGIGAFTTIGTSLLLLPLVLGRIGLEAYGIWAIGMVVVTYATTLGAGMGPTVKRYAAVADGSHDLPQLRRLFWAATASYVALGGLVTVVVVVLAPVIVSVFSVPDHFRASADLMVRLLAVAAALALYAGCLASFLQGLRRYVVVTVQGLVVSVLFLAVVAVGLGSSRGIGFLALVFACSQALTVILRLVSLRQVVFSGRPSLPGRAEARSLLSFTGRMQVVPASMIINNQSDRVVLGLVASPRIVGEYAIGAQVATAVVMLVGTLIGPMAVDFAHTYGKGGTLTVYRRYRDFQRRLILLVCGLTALVCAAFSPLLDLWLKPPTGLAATFGILTLVALAFNLTTGPATSYLRAIGKPKLEAHYGLVIIAGNIIMTIAFALLFGKMGVVVGTVGAYAVATSWFFMSLRDYVTGAIDNLAGVAARGLVVAIPLGIAYAVAGRAIEAFPSRIGALAALVALGGVLLVIFAIATGAVDRKWCSARLDLIRAGLPRTDARRQSGAKPRSERAELEA